MSQPAIPGTARAYFENIGDAVVTTAKGLAVTLRHLFIPSVTMQYPTERRRLPERSRMRLFNKIEDCIGCRQCERACPVSCITIVTEKRGKDEAPVKTSGGTPIKLRTTQFDIDMTQCCYCGFCTYPCPTECLIMTPEYEFAVYRKQDLFYRFAKDEPAPKAAPKPAPKSATKPPAKPAPKPPAAPPATPPAAPSVTPESSEKTDSEEESDG